MAALAREAGLGNVRAEAVETPNIFRDFENYWRPFTLGTGPAPGYYKNLDKAGRKALKARLESSLAAQRRRPDPAGGPCLGRSRQGMTTR